MDEVDEYVPVLPEPIEITIRKRAAGSGRKSVGMVHIQDHDLNIASDANKSRKAIVSHRICSSSSDYS
jgi:hypothetical protein